jgi:TetR/AcrR family transcriptional regulator, repressor for neighboring sulfatase
MPDADPEEGKRGRERTTAAILRAAEELFAEQGFSAVTVRAIAERAGVSHALVHRYLGSKAQIYRTVLVSQEDAILGAASDDPDLIESAALMFRSALDEHRRYIRLIAQSALHGLPYDRTSGRFAATERLIELAELAVASAPAAERAEKDLDPRLVVAAVVALLLGWVATESWVRPAAGLAKMDEGELEAGLERLIRGMLSANVAGLGGAGSGAG